MNSTIDDIRTCVDLLAGRCNALGQADDTLLASWAPDLARYPRSVLFAAARSWPAESSFLPPVGTFLVHVQAVARNIREEEIRAANAGELALSACPHGCMSGGWITADDGVQSCPRCYPLRTALLEHRARPGHPEDPMGCLDCAALRRDPNATIGWLEAPRAAEARAAMLRRG